MPKAQEAIISPDVFRAAQDIASARRPAGRVVNAEPFLLSGLAYCAYCGNKMMGVTRRQAWRRKDGRRANGVYRYYQCQSRNNQSLCGYHTWRASLLEGTVVNQLRYALRPAAFDSQATTPNGVGKTEANRVAREARVRNHERRFLRVLRRAARGEASVATLGRYLDELDDARKMAESAKDPSDDIAALDRWESLDFAALQRLLQEHVGRIVVSDDAVDVAVQGSASR